jgi:DNA-binding NtrC family response regulator
MAAKKSEPAGSILIVAADRDTEEALTELLQEDGFAVATAVDSNDALDQLRDRGPKLVLVDLKMYLGDGRALVQLASGDESLRGIRVVLVTTMSSHSTSSDEPTLLCEPVDIERIVEVARRYCGQRREGADDAATPPAGNGEESRGAN